MRITRTFASRMLDSDVMGGDLKKLRVSFFDLKYRFLIEWAFAFPNCVVVIQWISHRFREAFQRAN